MSVPRTLDGFDVAAAVERMLDQPALWWRAIGLFVEHFANWEQTWQECIGDTAGERKCVHSLRGAAANLGATALAATAAALEKQLLKRLADPAVDIPDSLRQDLQKSFRHAWLSAAGAWKSAVPSPAGRAR